MTQQYRYLRAKERIRKLAARRASGEELVLSAVVARVHNYIDAALELVATNRELYGRANRVFLVARVPYRPELVQLNSLSLNNYRARGFQRSVYVWSDTFNRFSNTQLVMLLKTQSITRVILSASSRIVATRLDQFLRLAREESIEVELMVADNSWVNSDRHEAAAARVAALGALSDSMHLDVEPQALDDYRDSPQIYQDRYVNLIRKIREVSPDLKLYLSVPFHWQSETYHELASLVDRMYVMNYGNNSIDTLVRRMKQILLEVPLSKTAMAVRPEDFSSPYQMEEILTAVHSATGINQFAIHKLASFTADLGYRP